MKPKIQPLSLETLSSATNLVHNVFPDEANDSINPGRAFRVSLDPKSDPDFWEKDNADHLEYYVATFDENSVVGTTGLYHRKEDPFEIAWLGWYCVHADYRNLKIGQALLAFTIDLAKTQGRKELHLYTEEKLHTAQYLYNKLGFVTYMREDRGDLEAIYKKLVL